MVKTHSHKWKIGSFSNKDITFRCNTAKCNARVTRNMTREELKFYREHYAFKFLFTKPNIHGVSHEFDKRFKVGPDYNEWRWTGYDLMERVERWAKKHPGHVRRVHVDDDCYANSDLILLEHKTENEYHGTSVIYIPQCTGEKPIRLFLYPGDRVGLIGALIEIGKQSKPIERREKRDAAEREKQWKKIVRPPPQDAVLDERN